MEKENAIKSLIKLKGHKKIEKAKYGTIRKTYGISIEKNSIHSSGNKEQAYEEIKFFFPKII